MSLIDVRKAVKMFIRVNVPIFGIVENMSYFLAPDTKTRYDIFGSGGGESLAKEFDVALLGQIPIDPRIREGGDAGKPVAYDLEGTVHEEELNKIAKNLVAQIENKNGSSNDLEIEL